MEQAREKGKRWVISTREEMRLAAIEVAREAKRKVSIFTHDLEPGIYDDPDFLEVGDGSPIVDKTDLAGYYVCIGTSGSSFKTAPVLGSLMAEIVTASEQGRDVDEEPIQLELARDPLRIEPGAPPVEAVDERMPNERRRYARFAE